MSRKLWVAVLCVSATGVAAGVGWGFVSGSAPRMVLDPQLVELGSGHLEGEPLEVRFSLRNVGQLGIEIVGYAPEGAKLLELVAQLDVAPDHANGPQAAE